MKWMRMNENEQNEWKDKKEWNKWNWMALNLNIWITLKSGNFELNWVCQMRL